MRPFTDGEDTARYFIDYYLEHYADGDPSALLEVAHWAMQQSPDVPDSVASAFGDALFQWKAAFIRDLDDAFNVRRPKGWRQKDQHIRYKCTAAVYLEVKRLHQKEGLPLEDETFRLAGERWGVGTTLAKEMYYSQVRRLNSA